MSKWQETKIGDICRLLNGRAYNKHELLAAGPTPVLRVGNFFTNTRWYYSDLKLDKDKYCEDGDLLYAWSASFGPRIWEGGKVIYHYHIWKIEPDSRLVDKRFLFYFLDWDKEKIKSEHGAGTTMVHVTKGSMEARKLRLPPLPEQRRIVVLLDEAFAGLETLRASAIKNVQNARDLYQRYLLNLFESHDSTWLKDSLHNVCEKITDGTHQTPNYFDEGYVFLSSRNVTTGVIDWERVKYIDEVQHNEMQKRVSPKIGDILLAKNGTTGIAAIVDRAIDFDIYVSLALIRPKKIIINEFMLLFINSPVAKTQFNKRLKGVGVPNLHLKEIREVSINYPKSLNEQKRISEAAQILFYKVRRLETIYEKKFAAIDELKQSILHQAFSGQLTKSEDSAA